MGRLWAAQELLRSLGQLGGALEICRSTGGLCELWSSWGALQLLRNSEVFGAPGELWSFGAAAELAGLFSWWLRHHLCLPKASGTRTHTHTLSTTSRLQMDKANVSGLSARAFWKLTGVGFEPKQLALVELEPTPFDHSSKLF